MNATARRTNLSHTTCTHDATPAARKACRTRTRLTATPFPIGTRVRYVGDYTSHPANLVGIVAAHDLDYNATGVHVAGTPCDRLTFAPNADWVAA